MTEKAEEAVLVLIEDGLDKEDIETIEEGLEHYLNAALLTQSEEDINQVKETLDRVRKAVDVVNPPANRKDVQELLKEVRQ